MELIRFNQKGTGYRSLMSIGNDTWVDFDEVVLTSCQNHQLEEVTRKLSSAMDACMERWVYCISWHQRSERGMIGYARKFRSPDEHGRSGLRTMHIIEVPEPAINAQRYVYATLLFLGLRTSGQIANIASSVSISNEIEFHELLKTLSSGFRRALLEIPNIPTPSMLPAAYDSLPCEIRHDGDCGQSYAWMRMSRFLSEYSPPWMIYDQEKANGDWVTTCNIGKGESQSAMRQMCQGFILLEAVASVVSPANSLAVIATSIERTQAIASSRSVLQSNQAGGDANTPSTPAETPRETPTELPVSPPTCDPKQRGIIKSLFGLR